MTFEEVMNIFVVKLVDDKGNAYYHRDDFQLVWDTAYNEGQRKVQLAWFDSNQRRIATEGIRAGITDLSSSVPDHRIRADGTQQAAGVTQSIKCKHIWIYREEDYHQWESFRCMNCGMMKLTK